MFHESIIIGIYGIQGVGKSYLLNQIAKERIEWRIVDGSTLIRNVLEERGQNMEDFEKMDSSEKATVRKHAIERTKQTAGVTLIAGHCSFPCNELCNDEAAKFSDVFTEADGSIYDLIVYLEKPVSKIIKQVDNDKQRARKIYPEHILQQWVDYEKSALEVKCSTYGIDYCVFSSVGSNDISKLISLIVERVVVPASEKARLRSERELVEAVKKDIPAADVYLLIDGDGTLCSQDSGTFFFDQLKSNGEPKPSLQQIFKRYNEYCFQAFWEVSMLYSNAVVPERYSALCESIGKDHVKVFPAWKVFLNKIPKNVHPIIVSSSIREVWLSMQQNESEHDGIQRLSIIAGNNMMLHPYLIDDNAKAIVAKTLRKLHGGCRIISFGDSALDVPMMSQSDHLYIVVNSKMNRSMKEFISTSTRVQQIVDLDPNSLAWHNGIPIQTLESILDSLKSGAINSVVDCASTSTTAKMYASKMRDASLCGTDLQHVHVQVGKMLAARLLDECGEWLGLVEFEKLPHVQGGTYEGLTTSSSKNMLILPLMRGGEPMARGIHETFPAAWFVHFYDQEKEIDRMNNLLEKVLESFETTNPLNVFITDSVINTGKSIERTIKHVMKLAQDISPDLQLAVFVLSGVMQQEAADKLPIQFPKVRFVTLRVSKNKYKGVGGTDTGNRLFCTV